MIIASIRGGLGNQLFQYAVGRRLASKHNTELLLDLDWYRATPASNTKRDFELFRYPIAAKEARGDERLWCRLHAGPIISRLGVRWGGWRLFRERGFDFDDSVLSLPKMTYLSGYWQSYRYFDDIADLIRAELIPIEPPSMEDSKIMARMMSVNSVSIHIRRGDYINQRAAAAVHGNCSPEYYDAALSLISSLVYEPEFFVFSDDIDWVKKNMQFPGLATFLDHNNGGAAFQDLRLMSSCKHHIIANSSFSWWGAWLNPSDKKHVVAPCNWFADRRATPTLMPKSWFRI